MMDESFLMPTNNMTTMPPQPKQNQILRCPRCESTDTKFCYYNNYSLSQPRHFCKACKRYWTRGGTLRNVPVGGGCRKNKRVIKKSSATAPPAAAATVPIYPAPSFNLDNFNSFLPSLPPSTSEASSTPTANHATNFANSYSRHQSGENNQFQLGLEYYPSLLTYQNLQNSMKSNVIDPWQLSNFVNNPFETLGGYGESSYLYWNVIDSAAAWPDVTNSSIGPLV